jgi:cytochrome c oxidase cbb3-type subunit 4
MMASISGFMTLLLIILFLLIWAWAWNDRNKEKFNRMANLPLEDNDDFEEAGNAK